jgi:trehalose 6-phosphate synthase/phosphatase
MSADPDGKSDVNGGVAAGGGGATVTIVSNRLPVTAHRTSRGIEYKRSAGGLIAALEPMLRERGGTWIGWSGLDLRAGERLPAFDAPYRLESVRLSETEVTRFYQGGSNRTLWPLFHSLPDRTRYDRRDWETYVRVNARFGESAAAVSGDAGLVWVHDYQLMLAPTQIRRLLPNQRVAFFLHIPFPPFDVFRLLPWDRDVLRGLLACDLVGFHVHNYARNFMDCVERLLGLPVDRERMLIEAGDRVVGVGAFPLGIDFARMEQLARSASPARSSPGERIVFGADRLDYTKGIPERIRAFERFLELHPSHRGKTVLLQVAVPSRSQVAEYRELKREIDELVGRVNGRFATETWSPIRYLYRDLSPEQLAGLYRDADVALVTPLRDGMNLVAKEFIASQVGRPGVLVLSRLAGCAETMSEALLVNPCDIDGTAAALDHALSMPEAQRRERLDALRARERRLDVHAWAATFLGAALADQPGVQPPSEAEIAEWLDDFLKGRLLALVLDYDGTLVPLCAHPDEAVLAASMREVLEACAGRADTDVTIVSGRALADLRELVDAPELTLAGNHGLEIAGPGLAPFRHEDLHHFEEAIRRLALELGEIASKGAWVEAKGATLTFHYRGVPERLQADLAADARALVRSAGFRVCDAHAAVEVRPPIGWDKGHAVLYLLRQRYGPTWSQRVAVVYVGDDETDEDALRALRGLGCSFRVGPPGSRTHASHRLHDVSGVEALLAWIARRPIARRSAGERRASAAAPTGQGAAD